MKRNVIFICCCILLRAGTIFANDCDTMQCINTIMHVINNALPVEVSSAEWSGEWYLDEWQQIQYMPQEEIYQTSHIIDHMATVDFLPDGQGVIKIEGYCISLGDCNQSVINIPNQQVDNAYGSYDNVYGSKLVLKDGRLYVHLRIVGTQDFAADIYCVGTQSAIAAQAQQFSTLYFEDKNGLKDSLKIAVGLSDEEINAIPTFSKSDVENAMEDSTHWVYLFYQYWKEEHETRYSRVYVYQPYNGLIENRRRHIYFPIDRLPVTVSWDQQFYIDNDIAGSVLCDMPSWFDAGCGYNEVYEVLSQNNSCVVPDNCPIEWAVDNCTYEFWGDKIIKKVGLSVGTMANLLSVEDVKEQKPSATKTFHDGHIYIQRGGRTYTATGQEIK